MKASFHMAVSAAAGAGTWFIAGPSAAAGLVVFGSFLDVDHIEHYSSRGMPSNLRGLLGAMFTTQRKLEKQHGFKRGVPSSWGFPVLHDVEMVVLAAALGLASGSMFLFGAAAGMLLHILMDIRAYPMSPLFFSVLWRRRHWVRLRMAWKTWKA
jgi:amino acid transporter